MALADGEAQKQLDMTKNFLELSRNEDACTTLRSSGYIQLLVQILHANADNDATAVKYASQTLHNIVHSNPVEKDRRREVKILRLLDQILDYSNFLKTLLQSGGEAIADDEDRHPLAAISLLMKASFDEEHRHTMYELGALKAIPNLVHLDHAVHGPVPGDRCCNTLRRYALMALTNLTFGDEKNKAYLCGQKLFMEVVIAQLDTAPDELLQVVASVLRNLSWRADRNMKTIFNEIGTVTALAHAAMKNKCENTLKAILSALWNLSAHCSTNKAQFCAVDGALAFLVKMLSYEGPSKTQKITENAGGILRNVSSHIAVCEPYRQILREYDCLDILLKQLKSDNMTVVSNSCGTLWNLSARCPTDQTFLLDHGAIPLLRALINSKNAMVAEGSASALKNLVNFRVSCEQTAVKEKDLSTSTASSDEATIKHGHTCTTGKMDSLTRRFPAVLSNNGGSKLCNMIPNAKPARALSVMGNKCTSRDSIFSAKSDSAYEKLTRAQSVMASESKCKTPQPMSFKVAASTSFIESDAEPTEEQPIDYSMKYNEHAPKIRNGSRENTCISEVLTTAFNKNREPDVDQPTDFSVRYMENQRNATTKAESLSKEHTRTSSEILLILDDGVKSTQDTYLTPLIARAVSVNDLRDTTKIKLGSGSLGARSNALENLAPHSNYVKTKQKASGSHTPEKPWAYCDEGTPGYFSRFDSLNSLHNAAALNAARTANADPKVVRVESSNEISIVAKAFCVSVEDVCVAQSNNHLNSALETPLMFSRRSSMDSLVNDDGLCDDTASIISEYSRMQSGVISPSDIPDSPTQNMSLRSGQSQKASNNATNIPQKENVFEDNLQCFHVENTPAQFSCATSLSNLSHIHNQNAVINGNRIPISQSYENAIENHISTQTKKEPSAHDTNGNEPLQMLHDDAPCEYFTEDTPAMLSKACSNSNLSVISMESNLNGNLKEGEGTYDYPKPVSQSKLNLPDAPPKQNAEEKHQVMNVEEEDPISKMRCGGNTLPPYLPVFDEMNKYLVEDSPCNFSLVSGLSGLTVGSGYVGPAKELKTQPKPKHTAASPPKLPPRRPTSDGTSAKPQRAKLPLPSQRSDSLSSLSIDSDDDTNLLSQAIAAGCGRPKANSNTANTNTLPKAIGGSHARRHTINPSSFTPAAGIGAKTDYDSSDSLDDIQSKSLFEQCIISGMHKSSDALSHISSPQVAFSSSLTIASTSTESRRNLKHYASLRPPRAYRQRRDDKLLNECINTGITTCAGGEKFVSSQVKQIESMLASKTPETPNQTTNATRTHHWV